MNTFQKTVVGLSSTVWIFTICFGLWLVFGAEPSASRLRELGNQSLDDVDFLPRRGDYGRFTSPPPPDPDREMGAALVRHTHAPFSIPDVGRLLALFERNLTGSREPVPGVTVSFGSVCGSTGALAFCFPGERKGTTLLTTSVYVQRPGSEEPREVLSGARYLHPALSCSGRYLAVMRLDGRGASARSYVEIYDLGSDGHPRAFTSSGGRDMTPRWAKWDGHEAEKLAFLRFYRTGPADYLGLEVVDPTGHVWERFGCGTRAFCWRGEQLWGFQQDFYTRHLYMGAYQQPLGTTHPGRYSKFSATGLGPCECARGELAFSPDGKRCAFWCELSQHLVIRTFDSRNSEVAWLPWSWSAPRSHREEHRPTSLCWSRDGIVLFLGDNLGEVSALSMTPMIRSFKIKDEIYRVKYDKMTVYSSKPARETECVVLGLDSRDNLFFVSRGPSAFAIFRVSVAGDSYGEATPIMTTEQMGVALKGE